MGSKGKERIAKELELCVWWAGHMFSLAPHNRPMKLALLPQLALEQAKA